EQFEDVAEGRTVDRIAANADAGRNADTELLHLRRRFIAKRAGASDDADIALQIDVTRHDAEQRFAGADDAGAIRPDELHAVFPGVAPHIALHPDHVLGRDAVGDGNTEFY